MTRKQNRSNMRLLPEHILTLWPCEEWRAISGYDGYFVSNYGRVCSVDREVKGQLCRGRILRPGPQASGHLTVSLTRYNSKSVHVLVLESFVGPCPAGCEGLHADDNPKNNWVSNLRWGTRSDNLHDAVRNGKKAIGEDVPHAKLTENAVRYIHAHPEMGLRPLAQKFGVHDNAIRQVRERITWKHVA